MGIETVLIASAVVGVAGGAYSGIEANKAAGKQANIYDDQANAVNNQSNYEQAQTARSYDTLLGEQKLAFGASGRELSGSPLLILDQTLRDKETELNNIRYNAGRQVSQLRSAAKETKKAGRNAITTGIIGGISSGAAAYGAGSKAGNTKSKAILGGSE